MDEVRVVPRCNKCKKMFAINENDGTGLCPKCRVETNVLSKSIELEVINTNGRAVIQLLPSETDVKEEQAPVESGRFGVTNKQLLPALKKAIADNDLHRVLWLRSAYLYTFEKSLRYLGKKEQAFIVKNIQ